MSAEPGLSVKDAHGRQISLLNDACPAVTPPPQQQQEEQPTQSNHGRRRYHCTEPGCKKSFTTSGHLARHNRIHTGEKNFHCLYPGCPSRFSRQDNMMQHYRTHMSSKSRRHPYHHHHQQYPLHQPPYQVLPQQQQPLPPLPPSSLVDDLPERKVLPQLHRHKHIRSDSNEHNLRSLHQACLPSSTSITSQRYQPYRIPSTPLTPWPPRRLYNKQSNLPSPVSSPSIPFLCQPPSPPPMNYQHRHQIDATRLNNDSSHPPPPSSSASSNEDDSDLLQLAHIVSTFG